ncbi:MAG: hypothetical protein ABW318_05175, partial [Vicinamibacterales bacterium]
MRHELHQRLDGAVGEIAQPAGLPVVQSTRRESLVASALQRCVGHGLDRVLYRRPEAPQWTQHLFALVDRTAIANCDGRCGLSGRVLDQRRRCGQLVRRRFHEVVVETKDARRQTQRVRQATGQYEVDRMKLVLEGGDD